MREENRNYTEVALDGHPFDRHYRNPMTKQFQYEYALYKVISGMFESVVCRSPICVESLSLYFKELPSESGTVPADRLKDTEKKRRTGNDIIGKALK